MAWAAALSAPRQSRVSHLSPDVTATVGLSSECWVSTRWQFTLPLSTAHIPGDVPGRGLPPAAPATWGAALRPMTVSSAWAAPARPAPGALAACLHCEGGCPAHRGKGAAHKNGALVGAFKAAGPGSCPLCARQPAPACSCWLGRPSELLLQSRRSACAQTLHQVWPAQPLLQVRGWNALRAGRLSWDSCSITSLKAARGVLERLALLTHHGA